MYVLQEQPDHEVLLLTGAEHRPVATLKDEYGGVAHIIVDDGCYLLVIGDERDGTFGTVKHWFIEAVDAMKGLPSDPQEAYTQLV